MTAWTDTLASQLKRGDIVLMHPGHIRVVTAVCARLDGALDMRLGSTWYRVAPDRMFPVDRKEPQS
ncbi:hypothetical protein KIK06_24895 [Nocardiopsis sp. EMB25]|uniref:hypothetical protein n=1 Tax=Nocardiopsis sp. EMB25 TaxID=2835867 RepID=UPI00228423E8|nr:hypothetical protein [Nocardiopsis sp. EMB25]MCY9787127.1 hypothetical protein [Nocardiopsis sp. EMB25]